VRTANPTKAQIVAALAGDPRAQRELTDLLDPIIRKAVACACAGRHRPCDQDDIVQNVWLRLLRDDGRGLRAFDPERGSAAAYLKSIARHVAADARIKRKDEIMEVEVIDARPAPQPDVETRMVARDRAEKIREMVKARLPARTQSVFVLVSAEEAPKDIAATLGIKSQVVHNLIFDIRSIARSFAAAESFAA
jgi:RNA polymerase sigma factor (sigma-70 family)